MILPPQRHPDLPDIILTDVDRAGKCFVDPDMEGWIKYVISIGNPERPPPTGYKHLRCPRIRLEFDDVEVEKHKVGYEGATFEDVLQLVNFCKRIKKDPGNVVIHCAAGVSRSSAATLVLLAVLLGTDNEVDAVAHLLDVKEWSAEYDLRESPCGIHPNRRIVWLADGILQRKGNLLQATLTGLKHLYGTSEWNP